MSTSAIAPDARLDITVPFHQTPLEAPSPERVRALRRHLVEAMRDLRAAKRPERLVQPATPEPDGFAARVVSAGCALCQGFCCKGGGTHAYIDERTMARVRRDCPEADARAILRMYAAAIAPEAYAGSCLFHGRAGCTLPRSLRAELCNQYYCNGLQQALRAGGSVDTVAIIARRGAAEGGTSRVTRDSAERRVW